MNLLQKAFSGFAREALHKPAHLATGLLSYIHQERFLISDPRSSARSKTPHGARNVFVLRGRRVLAGHRALSEGEPLVALADRAQIGGNRTSGIAQNVRRDERQADDPQEDHDLILRVDRREVG